MAPSKTAGTGDRAVRALGTQPVGRLLLWTGSQTTLSVGAFGIYALTNAWFVARGVGETALAAVNLVAPLLLLLGAVSTTVGVGGASLISRSLGSGRPDEAARAAGTSFSIFWSTAIFVGVFGLMFLDPLLRMVGATDQTLPYARPYAAVIFAGAIFSTGFSSLIRAEGRMLFSTMVWTVAVFVQIVLDPLLIFVFKMGVVGAALGTVGGQAVSSAMAMWFFFLQRDRPYRIRWRDLRPHWPSARAVLSIGAPSFLAGFGATLLAVVVNVLLAVSGALVLAAYAVCARVQTFVVMPQTGIAQGLQPIAAYNAGLGETGRVRRTLTLSVRASLIYGVIAATVVAVAAPGIVDAFLSEPEARQVAARALRIIAIGFAFTGIPHIISAYFQSLGAPTASYLISIGTLLVIKLPLVLAFQAVGPSGIWIALALGEAVSAAAAVVVLWRFSRRNACRPGPVR